MEAERWRQIQQVYHSALDQEADSRPAFIAKAGGGGGGLRQAVESLLAHSETTDAFLEMPAMHVAAKQHARDEAKWNMVGKTMSHYRVIRELGAGVGRNECCDERRAGCT